ncbi:MAG: G1 family endopeptidase [Ktedonobacterales bacterium]
MLTAIRFGRCPAAISLLALAVVSAGMGTTPATAAVRSRIAHATPRLHVHRGSSYSTSANWAGYATTGSRYTDVKGSWTQPTATCKAGETSYSAFWVGLDGDTTSTVEQTGTEADCASGTPRYFAWYEMYPKFPVNLARTVAPGDSMSAEVSANGKGGFTLTISDATRHWTFSTSQRLRRARLGSAEWIAEAPSGAGGVLPLTDFGKAYFAGCSANGVALGANPNVDAITMAANGVTKAVPSGLSGGTAFTVTWEHH